MADKKVAPLELIRGIFTDRIIGAYAVITNDEYNEIVRLCEVINPTNPADPFIPSPNDIDAYFVDFGTELAISFILWCIETARNYQLDEISEQNLSKATAILHEHLIIVEDEKKIKKALSDARKLASPAKPFWEKRTFAEFLKILKDVISPVTDRMNNNVAYLTFDEYDDAETAVLELEGPKRIPAITESHLAGILERYGVERTIQFALWAATAQEGNTCISAFLRKHIQLYESQDECLIAQNA